MRNIKKEGWKEGWHKKAGEKRMAVLTVLRMTVYASLTTFNFSVNSILCKGRDRSAQHIKERYNIVKNAITVKLASDIV